MNISIAVLIAGLLFLSIEGVHIGTESHAGDSDPRQEG